MSEGKVDHLEEARNYLAGLKLCSPSPAERQQFADAAQAHALIALVEEVRGLRETLDSITEDGYTTGKRRVLTAEDTP